MCSFDVLPPMEIKASFILQSARVDTIVGQLVVWLFESIFTHPQAESVILSFGRQSATDRSTFSATVGTLGLERRILPIVTIRLELPPLLLGESGTGVRVTPVAGSSQLLLT